MPKAEARPGKQPQDERVMAAGARSAMGGDMAGSEADATKLEATCTHRCAIGNARAARGPGDVKRGVVRVIGPAIVSVKLTGRGGLSQASLKR
jgi:hypothetical protein